MAERRPWSGGTTERRPHGSTHRKAWTGAGSKKDTGHHGVFGVVENLGSDIVDAVTGIPAGAVETVRNPVKTAKAIGKSYADTYGPLLHGDVGKFAHNVYDHPLGPILDALTVVSLGAGAAATGAGRLAAGAGEVGMAAKVARLGQPARIELRSARAVGSKKLGLAPDESGPVAFRLTSKKPLRKAQQLAADRFMRMFDAEVPIVGEIARYGRVFDKQARQTALGLKASMGDYVKQMGKLKRDERDALGLILRGVSPRDYQRALSAAGNDDLTATMIARLENPELQKLWEQPTESMLRAYELHGELADADAQLKISQGRLTAETADARPSLWQNRIGEAIGNLEPQPQGLKPLYVRDESAVARIANTDFAKMGGGMGVPQALGGVNRGVLLRTGQVALDPSSLSREFLRDIKYGLFDDIHQSLLDAGVRVPRNAPLPEGWMYIRRKMRGGEVVEHGPGRPEQIGHIEKNFGENDRDLIGLLDEENQQMIIDRRELTVGEFSPDAVEEMGYRIIVPRSLVNQVAGEFKRSSIAQRLLLEKPTQVWRALVLGARVGFLVNNVVGNHLLYALRFAGPAGTRAYLNMLAEAKGLSAVRKVITSEGTPPGITRKFMAEFFPEHGEAGTYIGSQVPKGKLGKVSKGLSLGLQVPDRAIEGSLRRAAVEAGLRKTPRVREILKGLPRETRSFEEAARKAIDEDPQLARQVSNQVNDALGNYLDLSAFEQNAVRAVLPFYAWMRAISIITLKMTLETPGRADLLSKIGQVGSDMVQGELGDLPSYLRGVIILGDDENGRRLVMTTQGLNPFGTVTQVGKSAAALAAGRPGELGPAVSQLGLNPFLRAGIEQMTGTRLWSGGPIGDEGQPLHIPARGVGLVAADVAEQLPQLQLARGPSALYPERDLRSQILAYLGVPVKKLDVSTANARAKAERERSKG